MFSRLELSQDVIFHLDVKTLQMFKQIASHRPEGFRIRYADPPTTRAVVFAPKILELSRNKGTNVPNFRPRAIKAFSNGSIRRLKLVSSLVIAI